jgi:hypothetical protein
LSPVKKKPFIAVKGMLTRITKVSFGLDVYFVVFLIKAIATSRYILNRKNETKNIFSSKSWRVADYFYEAFLR